MSKKRRPPPNVSAEDIDRDLAEMRQSPITRPNLSFLRPARAAEPTPHKTAPVVLIDDALDGVKSDPAATPTPTPSPVVLPLVKTSPAVLGPVTSRPIHFCATAQDGHSPTEHLIYTTMWNLGRPESPDAGASRLVQMSQPELARRVGLTERNLRIAIIRLITKLAMEEVSGFTRDTKAPRVYRVFSEQEILRRRREAGLLWAVRRKGVQFVAPTGDITAPAISAPVVLPPRPTDALPPAFTAALKEVTPEVSVAFIARLWREAKQQVPDCTAEEAAQLVREFIEPLRLSLKPEVILQKLLTDWGELVSPSRLGAWREARRRTREDLSRVAEENRQYWEAIAADPSASEADRDLARLVLKDL